MPTLKYQADSDEEVVRSRELESLTLGALKKRAKASGILVAHLEDCDNDNDPKARVIELIIAAEAKAGTRAKIRTKANIVVTKTISNKLCTLSQGLRGVVTCAIDGNALVRWSHGNEMWLMEEHLDHVEMVTEEASEEAPGMKSKEELERIEKALNGVNEKTKQEFARLQAENDKLRKRCAELEQELKSKHIHEASETNATKSAAKLGDEAKGKAGNVKNSEDSSIKKDAVASPAIPKAVTPAKADADAKIKADKDKKTEASSTKADAVTSPPMAKAVTPAKGETELNLKVQNDKQTDASSTKKDAIASPAIAKAVTPAKVDDKQTKASSTKKDAIAAPVAVNAEAARLDSLRQRAKNHIAAQARDGSLQTHLEQEMKRKPGAPVAVQAETTAKPEDHAKLKAEPDKITEASNIKKDAVASPAIAKAVTPAKVETEVKPKVENDKKTEASSTKKDAIAAPGAAKAEAARLDSLRHRAKNHIAAQARDGSLQTHLEQEMRRKPASPVTAKAEAIAKADNAAKPTAVNDKTTKASNVKEDAKEKQFTVKALLSNTYKATAKSEDEAKLKAEKEEAAEESTAKTDDLKGKANNEPAQASGVVRRSVVEVHDADTDEEEDESF